MGWEPEELTCMTLGHELRERGMLMGGCEQGGGVEVNKRKEKNGTTVIA